MSDGFVTMITLEERIITRRVVLWSLQQSIPEQKSYEKFSAKAEEIEERDIYGKSKGDKEIYNVYRNRVLHYYSFWKGLGNDDGILDAWWKNEIKMFDGSHIQCERFFGYCQTFLLYVDFKSNVSTYLDKIRNAIFATTPYTISRIWNEIYISKTDGDNKHIEYLEQSMEKYASGKRFLLEYYDKPETLDTKKRSYHAIRIDNVNDVYATTLRGWEYFTGLNMKQSYDYAKANGIDANMCDVRGDFKNQLPIVLRILLCAEKRIAFLTFNFVGQMRLVCKLWNKTILSCGKFWKSMYKDEEDDDENIDCPLQMFSEYIIHTFKRKHISKKRVLMEEKERYWQISYDEAKSNLNDTKRKLQLIALDEYYCIGEGSKFKKNKTMI